MYKDEDRNLIIVEFAATLYKLGKYSMGKISIDHFIKILDKNVVKNDSCIEMNFYVEGYKDYTDCWLGKTSIKRGKKNCKSISTTISR